jgi:hypothetical protein
MNDRELHGEEQVVLGDRAYARKDRRELLFRLREKSVQRPCIPRRGMKTGRMLKEEKKEIRALAKIDRFHVLTRNSGRFK